MPKDSRLFIFLQALFLFIVAGFPSRRQPFDYRRLIAGRRAHFILALDMRRSRP